ncbi:MAG: hypothetical protein B7Y89_02260 [Novosphingobium sp. 32-60-15]|uniref:TetR/AcrR family transcriptional regulator n=1 Tax=unclassified Novosphingobium TaxID=2644732 RepID=UPI000BDD843A|nr:MULTISPECIES: hypothetical protein [unclassified Novosphingobium]OYX64454.1 MAG: hypothetical protein B7Y89_02260 [Novosphingobium sp. 32-60-15]
MEPLEALVSGHAETRPEKSETPKLPCAAKRSVGRPRRLTLDAIVDAACAVGIDRLEMCFVAERLNTGVATLYGYVRGRDHLLELVAERMATRALADTYGGTWQEVLRGHAALCFEMFKSKPEMIGNLIGGEKSDQEVAYAVNIMTMLENRGLSREDAADLYVETNQAVIGAAVMLVRRNILANAGVDQDGNAISLPPGLGDYRPTLDRIVRDYEERVK